LKDWLITLLGYKRRRRCRNQSQHPNDENPLHCFSPYIIGVRVEKALDKNGVFMAYQASLLLRENNSLSFLFIFSSRNRETAQQFATTIAQFLNLPIITNNALYSGL
jgi:hypothetical protein